MDDRKRTLDDADSKQETSKRFAPEAPQTVAVALRALLSSKDAGIVIGKGGKLISQMRQESCARIHVSEQVPNATERVLSVSGPLDCVAKAFALVAQTRAENQMGLNGDMSDGPRRQLVPTTHRLLVSHTRMGLIIGKQGSKIKEIQEASGATVSASDELLPHSTERVLTISGVVEAIHLAVYHVGLVLSKHHEPSNAVVPYRPGEYTSAPRYPQPLFQAPFVPAAGFFYDSSPPTSLIETQEITIPASLAGFVIGKGGRQINEFRQLSGSIIKMGPSIDGSPERTITLSGTRMANSSAMFMIYNHINSNPAAISNHH